MKKFLMFLFFCAMGCQPRDEWSYPDLFWGFAVEGFPITQKVLELQSESRISPEMIVFYLQWTAPSKPYESIIPSLDTIWNSGAVPCLTWEPMTIVDQTELTIPYEDLLQGRFDPYLSQIAAECTLWNKPLVIRFAQEMNLDRYHWGTSKENFGPASADIYIKMFQYVVEFFKTEKVDNVFWAFCPNVDSIPPTPWNAASRYYPGDPYVDILGMDGYNWNINTELAASRKLNWTYSSRTFEQIFQPLYRELKKINPHKPIIVFETATVTRGGDQQKSLWIQDAINISKKWGIKGIVWFQVKKEEDWRINQDEDYSYIPLLQSTKPTLQTWLLDYVQLKRENAMSD